jgi:hypothetical protein
MIENSDVLLMVLEENQWKTLIDLDPSRARPLISIIDHTKGQSTDRQNIDIIIFKYISMH